MENIIVGLVLILIFTASIAKIIIEKRKGVKCVGCPYSGNTNGSCNCSINQLDIRSIVYDKESND